VHLRSWLHCLSVITFVEYGASFASDFDILYLDIFWGIEAYIDASEYMGSASLRTSTFAGFPYEEKSTSHRKLNACSYIL
jgi:hypothetical protein